MKKSAAQKKREKNLVLFKKGVSGNPKGRPLKLLSSINKELSEAGYERVTASQISEAYETLFNLPKKKLMAYARDDKSPMFIRIIIKAMLSGKGPEMLEKMMDRAHGRAVQNMKINNGQPLVKQVFKIGNVEIEI